jgi:hypothetical protein
MVLSMMFSIPQARRTMKTKIKSALIFGNLPHLIKSHIKISDSKRIYRFPFAELLFQISINMLLKISFKNARQTKKIKG